MVEHEVCVGCQYNQYPECYGTKMTDGNYMNIENLSVGFICGQKYKLRLMDFSSKRKTKNDKRIDFLYTKTVEFNKVSKDLIQVKYNYDQRLKFLERFFHVFIDQLDAEPRYAGFREKLIQEYSEFL